MPDKNELTIEKLKIVEKLDQILEVQKKLNLKIYGDEDQGVFGLDHRVKNLETIESSRGKVRKEALKLAVGSFTIALGGAIMWVFVALKTAFIAKH